MADTLKKVLKELPPGESEDQGIKEYQKQVNALAAPIVPAKAAPVEPGPPELINPSAQYGNRQGEVRYAVDKAGNLTPIAVPQEPVMLAPVAPAHVAPSPAPRSGMKPIIPTSLSQPMQENSIPVYDNGGDVKMTSGGKPVEEKPEHRMTVVAPPDKPEDYMPRYGSEAAVANRPAVAKPEPTGGMKPIPLFDDGGDVDVNDGKHQMAIVKEGERVLTPEENEQYKAEHPEAKGAPVGFSGMVLPNDKNVQPEWDSEHKPTNKAYPGGAHMSIDNANVDEGAGDKEHFPTVVASPTSAESKDTTSLKPYGQVIEEKAKQKAAEKVQNPGFQPITSESTETQVQPKEERGTPEQREHLDNVAKDALGKGDFVGGGTALIQKNNLPKIDMDKVQTPAAFQRPGEPTLQIPGAGATPQVSAAPAPAPLTGKAAYHAKIQDYDTRYQQLMDKAAETNDPQYAEAAERVKAAKEAYQSAHPWGSPESAHPGILGRIGHVAGKVGNIAGDIVAPGLMAITPGTDIHKAIERGQTQAGIKEAAAQNVAENKPVKGTEPDWRLNANVLGPNGRPVLENSKTGETKEAPEGYKNFERPEHLGDQATYINQWYKDHPDAPKSTANDDKAIEAYGAAKSAAAEANKAKGKIYYYDTPNGRQGYTYGEAQAAGLKPEDGYAVAAAQAEKDRKADDTYNNLKTTMGQYRDNISKSVGQLLPTDVDNMSSMIESVESPDYVSKIVTGAIDDLYGKPVTGYNEKVMKGALTKKAYDAMSPAARQLVADYFTTLLAHFGNVKATLGQVPRNEKLITTEMNMIPKPYLNAAEAEPAFSNYTAQVERNNAHNVKFGKAQTTAPEQQTPYTNTNEHKQFINSINLPEGGHPADAAKGPNGETIIWSGKAGDPWVDLVTGKAVK